MLSLIISVLCRELNHFSRIPHLEGRTNIYAVEDPGFLIVNATMPDRPLTIFSIENIGFAYLPVGLHPVTLEALPHQLFHLYYSEYTRLVTLESEIDKKVSLTAMADHLQAIRGRPEANIKIRRIKGTEFINIMNDDKCLDFDKKRNVAKDSYTLRFKTCDGSDEQKFTLVPKMIALCVLGDEACPENMNDIMAARAIVMKKTVEAATTIY